MAFKIAGAMAFQDAAKKAKPVLLEPVMRVEVINPERLHGLRHVQPREPPGRRSVVARTRRQADNFGARPAVGDVRHRGRSAVADARARHVLDLFRSIPRSGRPTVQITTWQCANLAIAVLKGEVRRLPFQNLNQNGELARPAAIRALAARVPRQVVRPKQ